MPRLMRRTLTAIAIAAMFVLPALAAPQAQDSQASITAPTNGQHIAGLVPIMGTVTAGDFSRYDLAYSTDPGDAWQTFASATILLSNAQLGVWDATNLQGTFAIRLQVFRSDGTVTAETIVRGLTVGTPATPTPQATSTNVPPPPTFGAESQTTIQPTIIIEQPPTATPAPALAVGGTVESNTPAQRESGGGIDLSRFQSACLNGVWCAVGAYFVLGALVFGRWGVRRILKQIHGRANDE